MATLKEYLQSIVSLAGVALDVERKIHVDTDERELEQVHGELDDLLDDIIRDAEAAQKVIWD